MKRSMLLLILLTSCTMYRYVSSEPYSEVFENLPGTKDELFVKANEWMVKTFKSAESVIEYSDKEAGALMGKYLMHSKTEIGFYGNTKIDVFATIDIRIKDQRAMITISPIGEWMCSQSTTSPGFTKEDCLKEMQRLSDDLNESLKSAPIDF